ncbi:M56 family peptidase [Mucilaginibacter conchicola]|uniref:M56 family peptidase n=1 Tax=Mucilaginibacter conchicola TaxID=2303333 RepID=A0A372NR62_9SPHI|nr:M56 family metallopeptidase [Mucilaginibacter conchicola]RFZ90855.1 M56 family peptidase [Mucilaginibacter conchicola]
MPALFVFLLKVNLALLLFCAGYYLVLRPLTFYTLNRVYLVAAILFATVYPYIDLTAFAQRHENLAKPVQVVMYKWQLPAEEMLSKPDYWQWATVAFWVGVVVLGIRFTMQLFSLHMLYRNSKPQRIHSHDVRVIEGEAAPFSFWRSIYINPANHSQNDLEAILQHEQIHVNGWHTLDILLAELSCVFYWFNPGIWLMKKAVRENIEFITDRRILNNGIDSKSYQYSLVNVSFNSQTPGIVNHFNLSTIKKRIIMMNAKRSSRVNLTRYAFVIPVVVCSLLVFTISKAEVAKPFTIKLANAIKPVTIAIKEAAKDAGIAFADTVPAKNKAIYTTKRDTAKRKLTEVYLIKSDTGKKAAFTIKLDKPNSLDSARIVVDGKQISKEELAKLNPNTLAGVTVIKGDAKAEPATISIITKDSEEGKAAMMNSVVENPITKITINGVAKDPAKLSAKEKEVIASLPNSQDLKGKISQVVITRRADASANAGPLKEVVIEGKNADHIFLQLDSAKTVNGVNVKTQTYSTFSTGISTSDVPRAISGVRLYSARRDNKISDKVIVIDGKVATEKQMKKLSAFDIESMSVASGNSPDTLQKYGEKAKQGVVYITTKKAKN